MRQRTRLVSLVLLALLGGAAGLVLADVPVVGDPGSGAEIRERWLSDTGVPVTGNHHAVTAGRVDGRGLVFVPVSGEHGTDQCRLVALDAADGTERWHHQVQPDDCWIHSVATLALADYDGDGEPELIAPTAEERLYAFDSHSGERLLTHRLSAYGYSQAAVGPLADDGGRTIVVVDAEGSVFAIRPDAETAWSHAGNSSVWASPVVGDLDDDGGPDLVVGFGDGFVRSFEPGGGIAWNRSLPDDGRLTWLAATDGGGDDGSGAVAVDGDDDEAPTLFAATDAGVVYGLRGAEGTVVWSRAFGPRAAVHAVGDGDGDGDQEVYAAAADGILSALDARTGEVEWETTVPGGEAQFAPPPAMGDVDGDDDPELVSVTNGGRVSIHDPSDGSTLAAYERPRPPWDLGEPVPVWERPTLADTDGDGAAEVYVMYGDGRVAALEYEAG